MRILCNTLACSFLVGCAWTNEPDIGQQPISLSYPYDMANAGAISTATDTGQQQQHHDSCTLTPMGSCNDLDGGVQELDVGVALSMVDADVSVSDAGCSDAEGAYDASDGEEDDVGRNDSEVLAPVSPGFVTPEKTVTDEDEAGDLVHVDESEHDGQ